MIIEAFWDEFSENEHKIADIKKILAKRADKIITISEFSKSEILKYYPDIEENKIVIVPQGSSLKANDNNIKLDLPKKYLLFVGARKSYKNFKFMLSSIAPLMKNKNISLVVASPWDFDEEEKELINNLEIANLIIHLSPSDNELAQLYKNAICYIFPSKYEGFGIPVLEAFEFNCPVIASNTASLPEVGGDACEYFNPEDSNSILQTVEKVIEDENLRKLMTEKGKERLKNFSWENTALKTKEVYESII